MLLLPLPAPLARRRPGPGLARPLGGELGLKRLPLTFRAGLPSLLVQAGHSFVFLGTFYSCLLFSREAVWLLGFIGTKPTALQEEACPGAALLCPAPAPSPSLRTSHPSLLPWEANRKRAVRASSGLGTGDGHLEDRVFQPEACRVPGWGQDGRRKCGGGGGPLRKS